MHFTRQKRCRERKEYESILCGPYTQDGVSPAAKIEAQTQLACHRVLFKSPTLAMNVILLHKSAVTSTARSSKIPTGH